MRPGLDPSGKRLMVNQILTLGDGKDQSVPRQQITDAQVVELVWRHSQCVLNQTGKCPLLVFGKQMADEVNSYFKEEE
jgi:hypothetical protein